MGRMIKIRKWQFLGFSMLGIFYMLVYRKFLHPKSIMNSVLYHNALKYVQVNPTIKESLGSSMHMMNCNGKIYPLFNTCKFDIIVFGSKSKGKINVNAEYLKSDNQWRITNMSLQTRDNVQVIM